MVYIRAANRCSKNFGRRHRASTSRARRNAAACCKQTCRRRQGELPYQVLLPSLLLEDTRLQRQGPQNGRRFARSVLRTAHIYRPSLALLPRLIHQPASRWSVHTDGVATIYRRRERDILGTPVIHLAVTCRVAGRKNVLRDADSEISSPLEGGLVFSRRCGNLSRQANFPRPIQPCLKARRSQRKHRVHISNVFKVDRDIGFVNVLSMLKAFNLQRELPSVYSV